MEIIIPSHKRPNRCITAKYVKKAIICCHDNQVEDYKKFNRNEVRGIPDELTGKGMAVIRNYILDQSKEEEVLMLDDDIKFIGYYEKLQLFKMEEFELLRMIEDGFRMTKEAGTVLWGLNLQSDKKFYREYSPFSLSSVVLGPFFGIIKDKSIRFDERLGLKEDYDYCLQVLKKHRKILRFNKYHYSCGHINMRGGCTEDRTSLAEEEQAKIFQNKWGRKVVKIKRTTQGGNLSINPVVISPIKGI